MQRYGLLLALVLLALAAGCARMPTGVTPLKAKTSSELRKQLLESRPDAYLFRLRGPFEVETRNDREVDLSATEAVTVDWYLAAPAERAPLVVLLHGHENSKADHSYQGLHLATWGVHCVVVSLPNQGPWVDNGRALFKLVAALRSRPDLVDKRVDLNRIILAGHSFGGAAVAVALAEGAPVLGGILLDPAVPGKEFPKFLRRVSKPVMLIGADEYYSPVANRGDFFLHIRKGIAEISIAEAHHDDAQFALDAPEDPESTATEEHQVTFVAALTSAALSFAYTGGLDYAWRSFAGGLQSGRFIKAMRK
jgi:pimeloyl-ACP methyl ester carboxylesterase